MGSPGAHFGSKLGSTKGLMHATPICIASTILTMQACTQPVDVFCLIHTLGELLLSDM